MKRNLWNQIPQKHYFFFQQEKTKANGLDSSTPRPDIVLKLWQMLAHDTKISAVKF